VSKQRSGNPNPWQARLKRSSRKPGPAPQAQKKLWDAICILEDMVLQAEDGDQRLRALASLTIALGSYNKCLAAVELAGRVEQLEGLAGLRKGLTS